MILFTYGTLKKHHYRHDVLAGMVFLGVAQTLAKYGFKDLADFPALLEPGLVPDEVVVQGELYVVTPEVLAELDRIEGHPHHYERITIPVVTDKGSPLDASTYAITASKKGSRLLRVITSYPDVPSGNWCRPVPDET